MIRPAFRASPRLHIHNACRFLVVAARLIVALSLMATLAAEPFEPRGVMSDGTCTNPVINGDFADIIGEDVDHDGIEDPVRIHKKTVVSDAGKAFRLVTDDEFSSGKHHLIGIRVSDRGERTLYTDSNGTGSSGPVVTSTSLHPRSSWVHDAASPCEYSLDGKTRQPVGPAFRLADGNWRGNRIGLDSWNPATGDLANAGHLDGESFRYKHACINEQVSAPKQNT